jgi:hypothetical protein
MNTYISSKATPPQIDKAINWKVVARFVIVGGLWFRCFPS